MKAVLFDAGNTLIHLDYAFLAALLSQHGCLVQAEAVRAADNAMRSAWSRSEGSGFWERYMGGICSRLGFAAAPLAALAAAAERANTETERSLWRVRDPDAVAVLTALRGQGFRTACISNSDGRVEAQLRMAGLTDYLEFVIDSALVGVSKPDPRIFRLAADRLGLPPEKCLYVGDIYHYDVLGPRAVGMAAVLYNQAPPPDPGCPVIRRLSELPEVVAGWGA